MATTLKDGSVTQDPRLDRLVQFDPKSREFPVSSVPRLAEAKKLRSYTWSCGVVNDQGSEGACVGFGWGHQLAARPAPVKGIDNAFSRNVIYWPAQRDDEWPGGSYPGAEPFYEGTSVLAGARVCFGMRAFRQYRWCFSLRDLQLAVGYNSPAVLGLNWYQGMYEPDADGYIRPTGELMGGHCLLARGISLRNNHFLLHNSWGTEWGINGTCFISFEDIERLLYEQGEACVPMGQTTKLLWQHEQRKGAML